LAGSAAYGLGEALKWDVSLERKPGDAKKFYGAIAVCTLLGMLLNFTSLSPMKALFWAAAINGIAAVPLMIVIMIVASSRETMGKFALSPYLKFVGWLAAVLMIVVCGGLLFVART